MIRNKKLIEGKSRIYYNLNLIYYYRAASLKNGQVDITPRNKGHYPWAGKDADAFEAEWGMKPVTLSGYLDHSKELKVEKTRNGELGYEVITPFYTHLDENNEPCALFVNRGWLPADLHKFRFDRNQEQARVRGVLYRGDAKTKYSVPNSPFNN